MSYLIIIFQIYKPLRDHLRCIFTPQYFIVDVLLVDLEQCLLFWYKAMQNFVIQCNIISLVGCNFIESFKCRDLLRFYCHFLHLVKTKNTSNAHEECLIFFLLKDNKHSFHAICNLYVPKKKLYRPVGIDGKYLTM